MSSLATALSPEDFEELRVISNVPYFSRDTFEESREIFADLLNANAAVQASNNAPVYDMEDGYTRDLFDLCDRVLVSAEVKIYSAILMNRYIHAVRQKADEAYPHGDSEEDMFGDIKLRMISVIHIASKMHMIHFSPRISEIVTVVELLGMDYTRAELIESELSVLDNLGFDVLMHNSPVAYLEAIFHTFVVKHAKSFDLNLELYWKAILQLLELVYLSYSQVFEFAEETGRLRGLESRDNLGRRSFNHLRMDFVLLCCGIICIPVSRLFGNKKLFQMVQDLSGCAGVSSDDILSMAIGIYSSIMKDSKMHQSTFDLLVKFDGTLWSILDETNRRRRMARKRRAASVESSD